MMSLTLILKWVVTVVMSGRSKFQTVTEIGTSTAPPVFAETWTVPVYVPAAVPFGA